MKVIAVLSRGLLLVTVCFYLTGCPAQWDFVFVNATPEPLRVQYAGYKPLQIPSGESRKQPESIPTPPRFIFSKQPRPPEARPIITVSTVGGVRLYTANGDQVFNSVWDSAEYPYIYVRLTRTEIKAFSTLEAARR